MTKYIFITGGVVSSLGKGIASAAIGSLLQARGFTIKKKKMDPYLNVDPGTMNPMQHGEVYVTDDGTEADLDLGNYERMTGIQTNYYSTITSGRIYQKLLKRERFRITEELWELFSRISGLFPKWRFTITLRLQCVL